MFERFVSLRYLLSNNGFTAVVNWFSFIGIALGVATLVIVTSVMNGFREDLLSRIVGMKGHVVVSSSVSGDISGYQAITDEIKKTEHVRQAIPMIEKHAVLMAKGEARGVIVNGISEDDLKNKRLIADNITFGDTTEIIIGRRMAEILQLRVGDSFSLMVPGGVATPFGMIPKEEAFTVSGIFEVGMIDYDKNIVIMPLSKAQDFFGMEDAVSQIDVFADNIEVTPQVTKLLKVLCGNSYRVLDWRHSDASIFHAVEVEKNVMTLILSIIIIVAVFNIISGLAMLTNSKVKDIAILRAMGALPHSIKKIFFIVGAFIGTLGTSVGVSLGLLVSLNIDRIKQFLERFSDSKLFSEEIYFLSNIPSQTNFTEVFVIAGSSILLCFIATIYPSTKASKLSPAEALRI
ncbi:MAG: lipoprotein-releasing ABC transporter permease subunit [Holosporales bacterium]|jgi:lipoprotein-releasing system permease protein|nr:lipoprotein-releasing ABC transporter permease subunit [Holosporales bacterium]